jgi:hypothetical protein
MSQNVISAVFDSREEAQRAVEGLRSAGINDNAISIVGQPDGHSADGGDIDSDGDGHSKGGIAAAVAGGGVAGALLGVAALAIPGVGPLAAAGAIAASAVPTGAGIGAAVGATGGALTKMLTDHDVDGRDAEYYEKHIQGGGVFVSVDTRQAEGQADTARSILQQYGGHSASQPRTDEA